LSYPQSLKTYGSGAVIFAEGTRGDVMFVILDGIVEIFKTAHGGSSKVLSTLGKGEFFGEMALIDESPRSASAIAKTDAKLLAMNENMLDAYIRTNPDFAAKMIRNLAKRLRGANKLIEQALAGNTSKVVFDGLGDFARESGVATIKGLRISVPAFADWASRHLGVPERSIGPILRTLIERGSIVTSALGENEIIYPSRPGNTG